MDNRTLRLVFLLLLAGGGAFVLVSSGTLPERVATNFGTAGKANAYMSREAYCLYMVAMAVAFPGLLVGAIAWLPRRLPHHTNSPRATTGWQAARRERTLALLARRGLWLGCAVVAFICSLRWLLAARQRAYPPRLATAPFVVALIGFLACIGAWAVALHRLFK